MAETTGTAYPGVDAYETNRGNRWRAQWWDGDGHHRTKGGFRTEAEAIACKLKAEEDKSQGRHVAPAEGRITVLKLVQRYTGHLERPATVTKVDGHLRNHIGPDPIARRRINAVTVGAANDYLQRLRRNGAGPGAVEEVRGTLRAAWNLAIEEGRVTENPWAKARRHRGVRRKPERFTFTEDQLWLVAERAGGRHGRVYELLTLFLGLVGLRIGEAVALRGRDLAPSTLPGGLETYTVTVGRTVVKDRTGRLSEQETTKTGAVHTTWVPPALKADLEGYWRTRPWGGNPLDDPQALLFCAPRGGYVHPDTYRSRVLSSACKELGITKRETSPSGGPKYPTPHDLRRTAAGFAASLTNNPNVVKDYIGHEDVETTFEAYASAQDADVAQVVLMLTEQARAARARHESHH